MGEVDDMKLRRFNVTGTCVKEKHYMADISNKLDKIVELIEYGDYFTINRPRQYGKTTSLDLLYRRLHQEYVVISLSFEGVSKESYRNDKSFINMLHKQIERKLGLTSDTFLKALIDEMPYLENFNDLNSFITRFVETSDREVILIIDECDAASNNDIFITFLGLLRNKYLQRTAGYDLTFQSVILAGVHDVRNLKYKIRSDGEEQFNSPWNIAEDFRVDMSFNEAEIQSLLADYLSEHPNMKMNIPLMAQKIHYFTNGYPFLVSYLCKMIDELFEGEDKWNIHHLEQTVNEIVFSNNANFDSLLKNIGNHDDLARLVHLILIDGEEIPFGNSGDAMKKGLMYGIFRRSKDNKLVIHNPIYEMKIYNYLTEEIKSKNPTLLKHRPSANYTNGDGALNMPLILEKYSTYLKDLSNDKQNDFIEENARLLFSIFMKSIINGTGFMYHEPVISDRRRLDVLIIYNQFKYIVELKIWHGEAYYQKAQEQLTDYLARERLDVGYMIVHDFRKKQHRRFTDETFVVNGKELRVYFV